MCQKYDKGCTFYWEKSFEASSTSICFKINTSGGFTHKGYLLVGKAN